MYNRYKGNSGYVQKVEDGHERPRPGRQSQPRRVLLPLTDEPPKEKRQEQPKKPTSETRPPSPLSGLSGELGKIFGKLGSVSLETEDLLLIMVLYLLYRESGDQEFLIMIGALLFV